MQKQKVSNVYFSLIYWRDFRLKVFWEGILIGLLAGVVVVLFRYLLEQGELLRTLLYQFFQDGHFFLRGVWFFVLLVIACVLGWIVQREPMAAGSGIPQVKGILLGLMKMNWLQVLIHKLTGGVLAISAGLSLGREGPSIQLGAAVGQGISRMLGRTKMEERYLLTSGASAGLAAAFNAPLAGVMFSLISMTAYVVADICKGKPVYETLLNRSLCKQGIAPYVTMQKRMVVETVIASGATIERKEVKDVNWPDKALLVSIKRGEQELVPQGDTRMLAGDYLYVLVAVDKADEIRLLAGNKM